MVNSDILQRGNFCPRDLVLPIAHVCFHLILP